MNLNDRDTLMAIRRNAESLAAVPGTNPAWTRAYLALADGGTVTDMTRERELGHHPDCRGCPDCQGVKGPFT